MNTHIKVDDRKKRRVWLQGNHGYKSHINFPANRPFVVRVTSGTLPTEDQIRFAARDLFEDLEIKMITSRPQRKGEIPQTNTVLGIPKDVSKEMRDEFLENLNG